MGDLDFDPLEEQFLFEPRNKLSSIDDQFVTDDFGTRSEANILDVDQPKF